MNITVFGTYNTSTTPRIQVLIDGLTAENFVVTECNAPLKVSTSQRVSILRQPWKLPMFAANILGCWAKLVITKRRLPKSDAVMIGHLGQFDIHLARLLFRRQKLILDYMISGSDTARDRGVNGGLKLKLLTWLDNSALKAAHIVIVDTQEHKERVPIKYRDKVLVVYVGASNTWFSAGAKSKNASEPLKVIFFGNYTPLQGAPIIGEALSAIDTNLQVTMVGSGQDIAETKALASSKDSQVNITWLDWVQASELPELVANHDVCLGIFGTGPKAYRVVPNKIYQGAAAGCALITSDTPPQKRLIKSGVMFVKPGDPNELRNAIVKLSNNTQEARKLGLEARKMAEELYSPRAIVKPLIKILS